MIEFLESGSENKKNSQTDEIYLCQFEKFSCMGCCGHNFSSKEEVEDDLKANTELLDKEGVLVLAEQESILPCSGTCNKLVLKNGKSFCGAHPMQNNGKDYREYDTLCNKTYFCKTMYWFRSLDQNEKEKFMQFLREKDLGWWEYSMGLDSGKLKEEFLGLSLIT